MITLFLFGSFVMLDIAIVCLTGMLSGLIAYFIWR